MGPWTAHQMTWVWVLLPTAHWLVNLISGAVKWDKILPLLFPLLTHSAWNSQDPA